MTSCDRRPPTPGVSERACVVGHPFVTCDKRPQRWRFAQQLRRRNVYRVERRHWLDRKRAADVNQHLFRYSDDLAATREGLEGVDCITLNCRAEPTRRAGANDRPIGLNKCQCRRHAAARCADSLSGNTIAFQQCCQERTGFDVPRLLGGARPSWSRSLASFARTCWPTGRHDPRRSEQRRFQAGV